MKPAVATAIRTLLIAGLASLVGCGSVPETIIQQTSVPHPAGQPAAASANGAIFQAAAYRPMFEDRRARMVGDMLTIAISENTSAAKSAGNSNSKSGSAVIGAPVLFGTSGLGATSANAANKFEEKGAASSSNTFTGTITVTVIDVLPNGNLVVSGEKQVALDKGVEYVRFSGVVNPDRISGNVVASTQVADARVEYRTNSRIDRAEFMSQVARFFMSVLPL
jgi:flagellar L-ring protein FlgH